MRPGPAVWVQSDSVFLDVGNRMVQYGILYKGAILASDLYVDRVRLYNRSETQASQMSEPASRRSDTNRQPSRRAIS